MERIFGSYKRKFPLAILAREFSPLTQAKLVPGTCAVWNFIRIHDPDDPEAPSNNERDSNRAAHGIDPAHLKDFVTAAEKTRADDRRDRIAKRMWDDYQRYLAEGHGEEHYEADD